MMKTQTKLFQMKNQILMKILNRMELMMMPKPKQMNDYILFLAENYLSEPQTVQEALESPDNEKWIRARKAEHDSLLENNTWELVDLPEGVATEILRIRVARDIKKGTLQLDQSLYIEKILNKFHMNGCKLVTTPADPNAKLDGNKQPKEDVETEELPQLIQMQS
ncbi:hypothetical protein QE152_g39742 [Popillia japonica]|uniref:Reverse transcriptase Ty1/copia-type domain-containing protein n=1 Tax=Popillia japonica TaxID=7064 RepID=A0AAW1HTI9_POPJA